MRPLFAIFLSTLPLAAAQGTKCYYPEGNEATDGKYYPCNGVNTTYSQCCLLDEGDQCLPNGLCFYRKRNYDYRAPCSDKSWETCQNACPNDYQDSWINVKVCSVDHFCCNRDIDNGNCCEDGAKRFTLPEPEESTSAAPSSTTSSDSEPTGAGPEEPNPASPGENDGSGGGGLSDGAKGAIGGSIGGVAALALVGGLVWWLRRRGKKTSRAAEGGAERKGYWGGEQSASPGAVSSGGVAAPGQSQWQGPPTEVEGSGTAFESGGREVPQRYELGG